MGSEIRKFGPVIDAGCKGWEIRRNRKAASEAWRKAGVFGAFFVLVGLLGSSASRAQNKDNKVEFLVARRQIQDPFFEHSVIFMLPAPKQPLVVGLIINKPTHVTLDHLFPSTPVFKEHTEPAYFGGPVDVRIPSVVFRSATAPEHALRLYANAYLTFDADLISKVFQNSQGASGPRLFLGRAQWAPGQLQNEMREGSWYKLQAEGDLIFTHDPKSLWLMLHQRAAPSKYIKYELPPGGHQPPTRKSAVMWQ